LIQEFGDQLNPMGVHNSDASVTLSFRSDYASGGTYDELNNQPRVDIVAARLTPQDGKGVPSNTDNAVDLLSDVDDANANASFQMLENGTTLDNSGNIDVTERYSPGHYVIFAAVHESGSDGFETDSESNISVDGEVTIIGTEQLSIQEGETNVIEPDNPEPGDSLTFGIESFSLNPDNVTHAVAVYDASTFEDARFDLVVGESELGPDFNYSTDAELEHSINEVNGVADVEDGLTLNGNDLSDGEVRRPVDASAAIDFFAEEAGTDDPQATPITNGGASNSEYEQIDASVTAISGGFSRDTVTVDTFKNFSEGTYRYVVISMNDTNESQFSTASGTIELDTDDRNRNGQDRDGSAGPSVPSETVTPPVFESEDGGSSVFVVNVEASQTIAVNIPDDPNVTGDTELEQLNVTSTANASNVRVSVTPASQPTDGTPSNDRGTATLGYLNVSTENLPNSESSPSTFTFRVSDERLSETGLSPSNVVMYRYSDGSWNALETTHLGGNRYRAFSPGNSWFAIGTADPSVSVTAADLSSTSVRAGETATVDATVENTGDVSGDVTLNLTANGEQVDSRTVTVGAGETVVETFSFSRDQPGNYSIQVNGVSAGTLTVSQSTAPQTGDATPTDGAQDESGGQSDGGVEPGGLQPLTIFVVMVIAVLIGAAAYALRNQV
jgi:PGF-pre-PGF domain-containing protein